MIIFRTDGNREIGTGHIMRCLSIADAFRILGEESAFAVADASMQKLIEERGFKVCVFDTDFRKMAEDMMFTKDLIKEFNARMLIVDSYFVTDDYLRSFKEIIKLVYIDDLALFAYPADVLINYNIYAKRSVYEKLYSEKVESLPELLIGIGYAPLRKEFCNLPKKEIREKCTDVLISTGGADPAHLALRMISYIAAECYDDGLIYHVVIGAMNQDKAEINNIASKCKRIVLHHNVRDMKELICSCDVAMSAAGSTLYEICACGVPLITYVIADNQIDGAKTFESKGLAINLGDIRAISNISKYFEIIMELCSDRNKRLMLRDKMLNWIDGTGAERIALYLTENKS
ncbi:UDP-2,4-diacetamido-2,4,6-trideoxy-beta-L-altropyranose hydrolase [Ruminococcus sp.]|uniref:UDP-2,4-diacetamido-2,4, 6-trideoxy-beta-L-altropyranose hydrolase n=1 Tax=Ruminococcus sp. TaxID=41978 RepID=UPI0025E5A906|nr:UDP-2,4-diacetamido-2,4,6-trideoxy-beta-L-altropyranose hydrolase [Ruminococcus sp.]